MPTPGAKVGALTQSDLQAIWEGACDSSFTAPLEAAGEGLGFEAYTQMFAQFARASVAVDVTTQAMYILPWSGQSNPPAPRANNATVALTFARSTSSQYLSFPLVIAAGTTFVAEETTDWSDPDNPAGVTVVTGRRYLVTQTLVFPPGDVGPYTVQATAEFPGYGYNNPAAQYTTAGNVVVPGTIRLMVQQGTQYSHDRASLFLTPPGAPLSIPAGSTTLPQAAVATLVAVNEPDMFLPTHVGQYVLMTAGANTGQVGRITGYLAPGTVAPASAITLAYDQAFEVSGVSGTFSPGEVLQIKSAGVVFILGIVVKVLPGSAPGISRVVYTLQVGSILPFPGNTLLGSSSSATATITTILQAYDWVAAGVVPPNPAAMAGSGECWQILDWAIDLGLTVTNLAQPQNGTSAMLDELAYERGMYASTGESAASFRQRVASPSDTVSPAAIQRVITRALGGVKGEFLDTQTGLDGFFFDRTDALGCFFDTCCLVMTATLTTTTTGQPILWEDAGGLLVAGGFLGRTSALTFVNQVVLVLRGGPQNALPLRETWVSGDQFVDPATRAFAGISTVLAPTCLTSMRFQVLLDYAEFRGHFLVGVPPSDAGDPGFYFGPDPVATGLHEGGFFDLPAASANYFDGAPFGAYAVWAQVWKEVARVHEGGVSWDLVVDPVL
jgi:hypothetical protein